MTIEHSSCQGNESLISTKGKNSQKDSELPQEGVPCRVSGRKRGKDTGDEERGCEPLQDLIIILAIRVLIATWMVTITLSNT